MAFNTQYITFSGKGKWIKLFTPDSTFGDPCWKTVLYLSPEDVVRFKELKVKNKINQDEDGTYVNLKRPVSKNTKGTTVTYAPPVVTDNKGNPFNGHEIPNGSDITVTLEYYGWPGRTGVLPGHAIRMHSVQIDNLGTIIHTPKETTNEAASMGLTP